jgi:hypothetical protein
MGSFSDYLENALLDHLFGTANYTPPANIYVALSTTDPTDIGTGITEPPVGANYARVATAPADWNSAANGVVDNASNIAFPEANSSWGNITHFGLFDANVAGNMVGHGALGAPVVVGANDTPYLAPGNVTASLE